MIEESEPEEIEVENVQKTVPLKVEESEPEEIEVENVQKTVPS